ncbi:MAG: SdiA-regulated domain-containing protein [Planctomycetaceae bacterium]|nr:SdiA-regulated domain-containing protein [Planctomycetaceae bacterium]
MTNRRKKPGLRTVLCIAAIVALVAAVAAGWHFRLFGRASFTVREWWYARHWRERSLWLADYAVVLEAKPVDGVADNLSGLTWNADTGSLFAVVNNLAEILELSTGGEVLRRIGLTGMADPEAVEYIGDGFYILSDERGQKLFQVFIDAGTESVDARALQRITVGSGDAGNKGVEGLAWDASGKKLYAAKEKRPIHIYEVTGFPNAPGAMLNIEVTSDEARDDRLFLTDISGLHFNERYGHLLVLSDESRIILELDRDGHPVSSLSLYAGHGLTSPVPQPEGVAMDGGGVLYLVSEPNLFYVFRPQPG